MPAQPKSRVRSIKVYLPDHDLHVTRVRGVGFRQRCDACGAVLRGKKVRDVRNAMRAHSHAHHAEQTMGRAVTG